MKWGGFGKSRARLHRGEDSVDRRSGLSPQNLWVIGLMLVIFVALYFLGSRTRVGKQMTATATNPNAARCRASPPTG